MPSVQLGSNLKHAASQIHDWALCSFLSYTLYFNIFPELRGFIDSALLRHPSPQTHIRLSFHFHPSSRLSPSLIPLSFPHFLPCFLPSSPSVLAPETSTHRRRSKARPPVVSEKKGRDHQLADGGMQQRYRLEGSSIGRLSPSSPSSPSLHLISPGLPPLSLCQGGMTCWITKQPSHVSACSLCQPRESDTKLLERW